MKHGKRYLSSLKVVDREKYYPLNEAIEVVKKSATAKFDETIEAHFVLHIEKKHTIRGTVVLPNYFGKPKKVMVFAKGDFADLARKAGAAYVGDSDYIEKIKKGWIDFDVCIATPDMMREVGKIAKILGPKGLMPSPKVGTVTKEVDKAIEEVKKGKVEYRADKTGNIHIAIGKKSMDNEKIIENFKTIYKEILKKRPSDLKGEYIKKIYLASTMGPGIRVDIADLR